MLLSEFTKNVKTLTLILIKKKKKKGKLNSIFPFPKKMLKCLNNLAIAQEVEEHYSFSIYFSAYISKISPCDSKRYLDL